MFNESPFDRPVPPKSQHHQLWAEEIGPMAHLRDRDHEVPLTRREHHLIQQLRSVEARVVALENILLERQRDAAGGLSFPSAIGGELGLCETIEPLPKRVPWRKRDGFTAPMAALGLFVGGGLLVALLASL